MTNKEQSRWNSRSTYLMAMIGSAIGVGNIWRFPNVLYANGGSSFMVPYICAFLTLGIFAMLLENTIGYKFRHSVPKIMASFKKKFEPIGWFMLVSVFLILSYYVCIMGWDLIYLVLSFFKGWGSNPNFYFSHSVVNSTNSIKGIFTFVPIVLTAIVVIWLIIFSISRNEINKGIGKIAKILIPILIICVIFIVAFSLTLPGAYLGYGQLFNPDWSAITHLDIWLAAFGQILFSLGLGEGIIIAYAIYLPEDTDLFKNTLIVASSNSAFEVFNAIGIFSILGFMTLTSGIPFNQLITDGSALAFIVFPSVFNLMGNWAYIIGPIFFLSLFIAGITSAVALLEPIAYGISDKFGMNRKKSVLLVCAMGFCVSLLFATRSGSMLLSVFDIFACNGCLILALVAECVLCTWFYNFDKFIAINKSLPSKLGRLWKFFIKYFLPIFLILIWIKGISLVIIQSAVVVKIIMGVLAIVVIAVPLILTKLSPKNKDFYVF